MENFYLVKLREDLEVCEEAPVDKGDSNAGQYQERLVLPRGVRSMVLNNKTSAGMLHLVLFLWKTYLEKFESMMKVLKDTDLILLVELPLGGGFEIGFTLAVVFLTTHLPYLSQLCELCLPPNCCRGPPACVVS